LALVAPALGSARLLRWAPWNQPEAAVPQAVKLWVGSPPGGTEPRIEEELAAPEP